MAESDRSKQLRGRAERLSGRLRLAELLHAPSRLGQEGETEEFRLHFRVLRLKTRRLLSGRRGAVWAMVVGLAQRLLEKKSLTGEEALVAMREASEGFLKTLMDNKKKGSDRR